MEREGLRFTWEAFQKYLVNGLIYGGSSILLAIVMFYLFRTYILYKISIESFQDVTNGDKHQRLIEFVPMFSLHWLRNIFLRVKMALVLKTVQEGV